MDYGSIYNALITKAQARATVDGYKERHHIVPRSLGGSDDKLNLVELTAREHFIAHVLLAKLYGGNMWFAVLAMVGKANRKEIYAKGRMYEVAKKENSKIRSQLMTGTILPYEVREKIKTSLMSNTNASGFRTIETRENISNALCGRKLSILHAKKVRLNAIGNKSMTGQSHSDETRTKMSASQIGRLKTLGMTGKTHSEETKQKMRFAWGCKSLNKLIDSVFLTSKTS
jgi:hypothetical protein